MEDCKEIVSVGRVFRSDTANGSKSRAVASCGIGGNFARTEKNTKRREGREEQNRRQRKNDWRNKLAGLKEAIPIKTDWHDWKRVVVYYYGSGNHRPALPVIDEVKEHAERRQVQAFVVGEEGSNLRIEDDMMAGVRIKEESIWRIPRACIKSDKMFGKGESLMEIYNVFKNLEGKLKMSGGKRAKKENGQNPNKQRVAVLDGVGSQYLTIGTAAKLYGKGVLTNMGGLEESQKDLEVYSRYIMAVEHCMMEWMSPAMMRVYSAIGRECGHCNLLLADGQVSRIWPSMVVGRNVFLNVHDDNDYSVGIVTVIAEEEEGAGLSDDIICYFCFPTLGIAIPLRSGDLLLFNPRIPHCVSARVDGRKEAYCVSFYIGDMLVSGKDKERVVYEREHELSRRFTALEKIVKEA